MFISTRRLALSVAAVIAATLTGGIAAATGARAAAPVTGTLNRPTAQIKAGPGDAFGDASTATDHDTPYEVLCAVAPKVPVPELPAPSAVWLQLGSRPVLFGPTQPGNYIRADEVSLTQDGKAVTWTALPACANVPSPPEAVGPIPPGADKPTLICRQGALEPGPDTLIFPSEQTIDVEFDAALVSDIQVTDVDSGISGSGTALPQAGSTPHGPTGWHFTERAKGTGVTTHRLNVNVSGSLGGPNKEGGDTFEGNVAYTIRSTACGQK